MLFTINSDSSDGDAATSTICYDDILLLAGEDNLLDVRREVAKLAAEWWDLGNSLGVPSSDLDAIHRAHAHHPSTCLGNMLILWLNQKYNVRTILVCWLHLT